MTWQDHHSGGDLLRPPEKEDIEDKCSTDFTTPCHIPALCPIFYTGYNATLLILNHVSDPACNGTLDTSVSPPVVRFTTHACGSVFRTACTRVISDFSNIQTVNDSGAVRASDPSTRPIAYHPEYHYYCLSPSALPQNVSASSIALKDKMGSFSTLHLELFSDEQYERPLVMPQDGIELRTRIYVELKVTNLTGLYSVLLDRCYASVSPLPSNSSSNLNIPCDADDQLPTVIENGTSQIARCSFPAFRFMEQQSQTVSTYYLHCITRLCGFHPCQTFMQCNGRRSWCRCDVFSASLPVNTITSPEIHVRRSPARHSRFYTKLRN